MAPLFRPAEISPMVDVIKEMMGDEFADLQEIPEDAMYIASTTDRTMGAGIIAYPHFMEEAAEKMNGNFYLLPSSTHEVILVPDNGEANSKDLEMMVREVNETEVSPEEKLSENVYHYDSQEKIFEIAKKFEERKSSREIDGKNSVLDDLNNKKKECLDHPKRNASELKREKDKAVI